MFGNIRDTAHRLFQKASHTAHHIFQKAQEVAHHARDGLGQFSNIADKVGQGLNHVANVGHQVLNHHAVKHFVDSNPDLHKGYNLAHRGNQLIGLGSQIAGGVSHITNEHSYRRGQSIDNGLTNAHDAIQRAKAIKDNASVYHYI